MRSAISMGQVLTRFFSETAAFVKKTGTFKANKVWSSPVWCVFQGLKRRKFPDVILTDRQTEKALL